MAATETTKRCVTRGWREYHYHSYACGKPAPYTDAEGKPACYPHSAEGIAKRQAASFARHKAQQRLRDAEAAVLNAESAVVAAVMAARDTWTAALDAAVKRLVKAREEVRHG